MKQLFGLICIIFITPLALLAQKDSSQLLSVTSFINIVRQYHPVVKQAAITVRQSSAAITSNRGLFDPTLSVETEQKTFDGKTYYRFVQPMLKIPTWYGIEIKAGAEKNSGINISPETTIGESSYLGISLPLAKNLLLDKRRAALQQSKIFLQLSTAEQLNNINDLLQEAYEVYWQWVREYEVYALLSNAVTINEARLKWIRLAWKQGANAAIDTIEALAQLQNFKYLQQEAHIQWVNAKLALSNFCWLANNQPYTLPTTILPDTTWNQTVNFKPTIPPLEQLINTARLQHPKLKMYAYKINWLTVERKLKRQSLLPTFNLSANLLNQGYNATKGANWNFYQNNNKFGINFSIPLLLRQARGDFQQATLKLSEADIQLAEAQWQVENKIKKYANEVGSLAQQNRNVQCRLQ
jgi:outer membrane protein TolC